jgi:hypothetical protein
LTNCAKGKIFAIAVALLVMACNKKDDQGAVIVEVGDKQLTINELMDVVPDNSSANDSADLAAHYIQDWITTQLLIARAEISLPEDKQNFESLIENYRKSLLTYAYEQEWIRQKLDTLVTDAEIEKYYNQNEKNFQLKDYIVKVKFCALAADSKFVTGLKKLFYSAKPEDLVKWQQMCVDIGAGYYFDEDKWMLWDEFIKQVPLEVYDVESLLKKKKTIEFEKENNLYMINFTDYQLSGGRSPLSFEREKIRSMIINRRKLNLLDNMRQDLLAKAMQDGEVKKYYQEK